jgi:hypothetical protein
MSGLISPTAIGGGKLGLGYETSSLISFRNAFGAVSHLFLFSSEALIPFQLPSAACRVAYGHRSFRCLKCLLNINICLQIT